MDDISRELPPDQTGATPVSERQKGPEELQRFERGHIGEQAEDSSVLEDRLTGMGARFLADRLPEGYEVPDGHQVSAEPQLQGPQLPGPQLPGPQLQGPQLPEGPESRDGLVSDSMDHESEHEGRPAEEEPETGDAAKAEESGVEAPEETPEADVSGAELPEGKIVGEVVENDAGEQDPDSIDATGSIDATDSIDAAAAAEAVAAEASTAEVEQDLDELADTELGDDGLPIVPALEDPKDIARMVYVLMMTSREGMTVFRLAQACNTSQKLVEEALSVLTEQLRGLNLPVELTRVGDTVRWMSSAAAFPYLQRLRGVRKLERLSPAALETLAVIAYRQPVMRSEIEAIRGVKAGPMLRTLLQHKLVKVTGRADVPGKPLQYGTTQQFLERFGLASLQDLPSVKEWKNLG